MINTLDFKNITDNKIIFIGDIHGEFNTLLWIIKQNKTYFNDTILIVLGDCGIGFYKERYYVDLFKRMNDICIEINTTIVMFRGNHDDPSYFDGNKLCYSNIKVIPDYTIIQTYEKNILCIGGGLSIDRVSRQKKECSLNKYKNIEHYKKLYWENELPVYDEDKLNEIRDNNINIDVIATHTAPSFFPFNDTTGLTYFLSVDDKLKDDLITERSIMDNIYNYCKTFLDVRYWFYGHFHSYQKGKHEHVIYQMMPNIDEMQYYYKSLEEVIDENTIL